MRLFRRLYFALVNVRFFLNIHIKMNSVKKYSDIDINEINYSKPEKLGNSYFGSMCYGEGLTPLYIQTPILK